LPLRVSRAVSAWQDQLMRLMQSEVTRQQSGGTVHDIAPVSVVALVAMLAAPGQGSGRLPFPRDGIEDMDGAREVLVSVIGTPATETVITRARQDLRQRVGLLLDEELRRFGEVVEEAGHVDAVAAVRLYQAEYSLEAAR
jgi:hypothetical protein